MKKIMKKSYYKIPNMIAVSVQDYLYEIGRAWSGQGVAIELGSWCGGSSVPLLTGLVEAGYDRPFYAYDRWKTNVEEVGKLKKYEIQAEVGQDLLPIFERNVRAVYNNIVAVKGRIENEIGRYSGDRIEICIFDAPKKNPVFSKAVEVLSPYWIPGVTILGLLDYNFYLKFKGGKRENFKAPVQFMEQYGDHFEQLKSFWPNTSCVFFRYLKPLSK